MAVILPDRQLRARKKPHPGGRDAFGAPLPAAAGPWGSYYPGAAKEQSERGNWSLRVDVRLWPLNPGDELTDGTSLWVVQSALKQGVPGHPDVDFIAVIGTVDPPEAI